MQIQAVPDTPAALREALEQVASNISFSWSPEARSVFAAWGEHRLAAVDNNPVALLADLGDEELAGALTPEFARRVARVRDALHAETVSQSWWERRYGDRADFCVAYFSCEFGLDESLPIYSGGLGVLAGDHLKSASELGLPLVGVGLFYEQGYFRQDLDETGWQVERYPTNDPARLPLHATDVTVTVELADDAGEPAPVCARVWRVDVGRVKLYLLDTDVEENPEWARRITDVLYGGDRQHRIRQELVLGIGGVRALRALGVRPTVFHMNEGHSAFLQLERLRELVEVGGVAHATALERIRTSTVFTTHTPVPAGNEIFEPALVERNVGRLVTRCGFESWEDFEALGRYEEAWGFGLTPFALRTSAYANGVSQLHGEVSREMWRRVWPERDASEVPIVSVTNGVHARTWLSPELAALLGPGPQSLSPDFARAHELDDEVLWRAHRVGKETLMRVAAERFRRQGDGELALDPDALTIGFARRFATYKRADLLFSDFDRLARLLGDPERPLQILLAGKAHPADEGGKALIRKIVELSRDPRAAGRVVFLEDYEMTLARYLVQGVDVWLNTPRRPMEASGTSGMKAAMNGAVNCSILDGWWCEGYSEDTGFAIGGGWHAENTEAQDAADAQSLYDVLEHQVVPAYYERDERGLPTRWLSLMRRSIGRLGSDFSTTRMVAEYAEQLYLPADTAMRLQVEFAA